ncbi:MAG: hypothetical protein HY243_03945 [Proteobacteria bacterium]|nr:hypothetical protein [Pseudomonadota bacterium]
MFISFPFDAPIARPLMPQLPRRRFVSPQRRAEQQQTEQILPVELFSLRKRHAHGHPRHALVDGFLARESSHLGFCLSFARLQPRDVIVLSERWV